MYTDVKKKHSFLTLLLNPTERINSISQTLKGTIIWSPKDQACCPRKQKGTKNVKKGAFLWNTYSFTGFNSFCLQVSD